MARLIFLLLLWVGVTVRHSGGAAVKRIIGGQPCVRPRHVKLRGVAGDGSSTLCGGSLIGDRWILTAAHCFELGRTMFANLTLHPGGPAQEVQITAEPVIYTDRDLNNNSRSHDLMLLQLPNSFDIQPFHLPDCEPKPHIVEIAGHAATSSGPNDERKPGKSSTLHCADIEVVSCEDLKNTLQELFQKVYKFKVYQHLFCGQSYGKDICFGDSGGGVVHENMIYGVISFLGDPHTVCRKATAFMDICYPEYNMWIRQTIA